MSRQIKFGYEGKEYCLEYNREAIKIMEKQGFELETFTNKPMNMMELAFQGAFLKNHRNIKGSTVLDIYENMKDKRELANELLNMISETYNSLFDDENVDEAKNISWKAV